MKRLLLFAAVAMMLFAAAPVFAVVTSAPVPAIGVTPEEMVQLMQKRGWSAKLDKDSNGTALIASHVAGVNFDVYFYQCHDGRCTDIQFAAGWSKAKLPPEKINAWNAQRRFLRAYWMPGNALWVDLDARIAYGTTANIDEYLALWPTLLRQFKSFMQL